MFCWHLDLAACSLILALSSMMSFLFIIVLIIKCDQLNFLDDFFYIVLTLLNATDKDLNRMPFTVRFVNSQALKSIVVL